jgi:hypothetical protein
MRSIRAAFCVLVIAAAMAGGCASKPAIPGLIFCEYRPGQPDIEVHTDDAGNFALFRWIAPANGSAAADESAGTDGDIPREVARLWVDADSDVGFRMDHQQLIAVAGAAQMRIETGRYTWQILTEESGSQLNAGSVTQTILDVIVGVICGFLDQSQDSAGDSSGSHDQGKHPARNSDKIHEHPEHSDGQSHPVHVPEDHQPPASQPSQP